MTGHSERKDTIGWLGEMLAGQVLARDQTAGLTHNSMPDADDPTIGISLHGNQVRIPEPDWTVSLPGGLLLRRREPKTFWVEVKAKTYFGYRKHWALATTGIENWILECYQRLAEEYGRPVEVWFIQIFARAQLPDGALIALPGLLGGIYKADIELLYSTRERWGQMAYWPVQNGPFEVLNLMSELITAPD